MVSNIGLKPPTRAPSRLFARGQWVSRQVCRAAFTQFDSNGTLTIGANHVTAFDFEYDVCVFHLNVLYAYFVECLDLCVYLYIYTVYISVYINIYIYVYVCKSAIHPYTSIPIQKYVYTHLYLWLFINTYFVWYVWKSIYNICYGFYFHIRYIYVFTVQTYTY